MLNVGFWNIQRASNAKNKKTKDRALFFMRFVSDWIDGNLPGVTPPDIVIFCEVTSSGTDMRTALMAAHKDYNVEFFPVADINGNTSPCSFMVMYKKKINLDIKPVNNTGKNANKRPGIVCKHDLFVIVGVHIIASEAKALDEIVTFYDGVDSGSLPMAILGDMNYNITETSRGEAKIYFNQRRIKVSNPGVDRTFKANRVIDYCLSSTGLTITAKPPFRMYQSWNVIDHMPIAYEIGR